MADRGLGGTLQKLRKFTHRFSPRELSPTRLLEKFASDTKKKGAARLKKLSTAADARDATAQRTYDAQLKRLTALAPETSAPLPFAASLKAPPLVRRAANYGPWLAGGAALALFVVLKGKRR